MKVDFDKNDSLFTKTNVDSFREKKKENLLGKKEIKLEEQEGITKIIYVKKQKVDSLTLLLYQGEGHQKYFSIWLMPL